MTVQRVPTWQGLCSIEIDPGSDWNNVVAEMIALLGFKSAQSSILYLFRCFTSFPTL